MQAGFYLGQRYRTEENLPGDPSAREEPSSRTLYQANAVLDLGLGWQSLGTVACVLDTGELSEETIQDGSLENDRTEDAFFREGYFESSFLDTSGVAFKVGQQHMVSGDSFILDDFLLAGQAGLDLHAMGMLPLEFYGSVTRVEGSSLYFQIRAVHPFSPYETVNLSVGWLNDTEGFLADILNEAGSDGRDRPGAGFWFESEADLFWVSLSVRKVFSAFRVSTTAILDAGNFVWSGADERGRRVESEFDALGYLVDFVLGRNLTERLDVEVFCLMASGDDDPLGSLRNGETLTAYLAIVPFVTRLNLFFNGGIDENLSSRSMGIAGRTARGYGVPGVTVRYSVLDNLQAVCKAAYLFAVASPPKVSSGRVYGWETDLMGVWDIGRHVCLSLEADLFMPGSFFELDDRSAPDPAYRIMGGLDLYF